MIKIYTKYHEIQPLVIKIYADNDELQYKGSAESEEVPSPSVEGLHLLDDVVERLEGLLAWWEQEAARKGRREHTWEVCRVTSSIELLTDYRKGISNG